VALLGNLTGSSQFFNNAEFYNGVATQSLRRNDDDSAYLYRTPSSASNRKTYTFSCWYKRANLSGVNQPFFYAGSSGSDFTLFYIDGGSNRLSWYDYDGSTDYGQNLSIPLRDTTAWYHLVFAVDTTQGTDTNRVKIYVNGTLQTSVGADYGLLPQDYDTRINDTKSHWLGRYNANYIDGYMAEVNFVDGTQLAPTSFGETKNGVWIPKKYTGSYGTNGFRLQFDQTGVGTASASTIGADTSGNTHHFTSSGIVASDCNMPDSPENNFCTMNGVDLQYNAELLEGNLHIKATTYSGGNYGHAICTFNIPSSGKWYIEVLSKNLAGTGNASSFGVMDRNVVQLPSNKASPNYVVTTDEGFDGLQHQHSTSGEYVAVKVDGATSGSNISMSTSGNTGSVSALAIDVDNGYLYVGATDGTGGTGSQIRWLDFADGSTGTSNVNPESGSSGTGGIARTFTNNDVISVETTVNGGNTNRSQIYLNAGQDSSFAGTLTAQGNTDANGIGDFYYVVPSGYLALCTANLPESTIGPNSATQADNYFGTLTWSGDDGATRKIATGESGVTGTVDFTPDWSWIKRRNGSSNGSDHLLLDIVRGVGSFNGLSTNGNSQEGQTEAGSTWTNFGDINNFENGGFTVQKGSDGSHTLEGINQSGGTYVGWNWKAGGTASSNTDGSITSNVSANTDAGFSIVSYTGTGSATTVGHGLGVVPECIIIKNRDAGRNWIVYHGSNTSAPETDFLILNTAVATADNSVMFNDTAPTSSVFTVNTNDGVNTNNEKYIAYCFASVEGYSKINSYNPNNTTDSAFVYTGFKPAMVILKGAEINNQEWVIMDNERPGYNSVYNLNPNYTNVETTSNIVDFLSNGFKIRETGGVGYLTSNYIYMAFAEAPFKYANAG